MAIERSFSSSSFKRKVGGGNEIWASSFLRDGEELITSEDSVMPSGVTNIDVTSTDNSLDVEWDGSLNAGERFRITLVDEDSGQEVKEKFVAQGGENKVSFGSGDGLEEDKDYLVEINKQTPNGEGGWINQQSRGARYKYALRA